MKTRLERINDQITGENFGLRKNSSAYKLAVKAVENPGTKIRTGWYTGTGRFTSAHNHHEEVARVLIVAKIRFKDGNDSPKGGVWGNFIIVNK
jgi:hypothetical protein